MAMRHFHEKRPTSNRSALPTPDLPPRFVAARCQRANRQLCALPACAQSPGTGACMSVGMNDGHTITALLAAYSRDNECEANALGQTDKVHGSYPASVMLRLH